MSPFVDAHRPALADLCRRFRVRSLSVFGSATRDDFDPDRSDVDLLVEFHVIEAGHYADNYFGLREALEDLFGLEVDLVTASAVRNPYVKADIDATKALLYAA